MTALVPHHDSIAGRRERPALEDPRAGAHGEAMREDERRCTLAESLCGGGVGVVDLDVQQDAVISDHAEVTAGHDDEVIVVIEPVCRLAGFDEVARSHRGRRGGRGRCRSRRDLHRR